MTTRPRYLVLKCGTGCRPFVAAVIVIALAAGVTARQVIRSSTDLISIDVQVVDKDGNPVGNLTKDQFDIEIGGKKRPVQLVEFVRAERSSIPGAAVPVDPVAGRAGGLPQPVSSPPRQTYMLAVDAGSFSVAVSRGIATAAQNFVRALPPTATVGLFTFPLGPKLEPTTDHASVVAALDRVSGQKEPDSVYRYNVRSSEVVDWFADSRERGAITTRYCRGELGCPSVLSSEMNARAGFLEAQGHAGLSLLRDVLTNMASIDGRKILVLTSAGMTVSDRPGGRPDLATLPLELGEAAARSSVSIYTLFVDNSVLEQFSAERRQEMRSQVNMARDAEVASGWLSLFSGASGGALMKVLTGNGEYAFGRIVRETSAYYLVGVDATDADRTGRAQRIKVRVNQKGATVRSREFVVVPARPSP